MPSATAKLEGVADSPSPSPSLAHQILLFLAFLGESAAFGASLFVELGQGLVVTLGDGFSDPVVQEKFALGDLGLVDGIELGEAGFLFGGELGGRRLFGQPFHGEFVGGFHERKKGADVLTPRGG